MRWTKTLLETQKEIPAEAEVISHQMMVRAGLIRKVAAGIYDYLPLGYRVVRKIETIIREEMDRAGALEVLLPILSPAELWQETGRWDKYGAELFRVKDRHDRAFALGPTHEEVMTDLVRQMVKSYRQLPINLYQIHTKFRDEIRPRFGVMRSREFIMKDAYSFNRNEQGAQQDYQTMFETYHRIFERCGLRFKAVEADSGTIGGSFSSEFMVLADTGEDAIATCSVCHYAANTEKATGRVKPAPAGDEKAPLTLVATPNRHSVQDVADFLNVPLTRIAKTMLYDADGQVVAVLIRGDREVNEVKLLNHLGATTLKLASVQQIEAATGAPVGFAGPFGLKGVAHLLMDRSLEGTVDLVTGGNQKDTHATGVQPGRDFQAEQILDLTVAQAGDGCPCCNGELTIERGIEVGHVFKLGLKYSQSMNATFLDEAGQSQFCVMGCYGIGVTRIVAAAIEQNHDEAGIKWPMALAPYQVILLPLTPKDEKAQAMAESVYEELTTAGLEVLLDDRDERAGIKFKDADLLGIPIRLTFGKSVADNKIELKRRDQEEKSLIERDQIKPVIIEMITKMMNG